MCGDLTEAERLALDEYTGPSFAGWNPILRGGGAIASTVWDRVHLVIAALNKLDKCKGQVTRFLTFDTADELNNFMGNFGNLMNYRDFTKASFMGTLPKAATENMHVYTSKQFLSCKGAAVDLSVTSFGNTDNRKNGVLIKILCTGKHGGDLRKLYKGKDLGEAEILFPPGVKFAVLAATEGVVLLAEKGDARQPLDPNRKAADPVTL